MSKSVDETVFDFFELLLNANASNAPSASLSVAKDTDTPNSLITPNRAADEPDAPVGQRAGLASLGQLLSVPANTYQQPRYLEESSDNSPQVNKQVLEKLLAPVLKAAATDPVILTPDVPHPPELASRLEPTNNLELANRLVRLNGVEPLSCPDLSAHADLSATDLSDKSDLNARHESAKHSTVPSITTDLQQLLEDEFQVLFFQVAGLTLAVPLVSLGGIVKIERINHIIGRPSWFFGVQTYREQQLNIVDTGAWVMPEKYTDELKQTVNYQYVVLLAGSNWGLTCESLVNAVKINKTQVNWRSKAGKRPWLAGVVKQQMCGILHVQALVDMLDAGLGCQDSIN
ncbi:MAG: chemotaxis protein CheW [Shewanella sp.]